MIHGSHNMMGVLTWAGKILVCYPECRKNEYIKKQSEHFNVFMHHSHV